MPYTRKKKIYRKKRFVKKKRVYTSRIPRPGIRQGKYFFKRYADGGTVALSNAGTVTGGLKFQLDELPNYTEFTALFDSYKICAVKVMAYMNASDIQVQGTVPFSVVRWVSVVDYNSAGNLSSFNDAREFSTAKIHQYPSPKPYSRYFKPHFITVNEDASTSVIASGNKKGWLNTSVINIPHYGYRYFFEQLTSPYTGSIKFEVKYYLCFKSTK